MGIRHLDHQRHGRTLFAALAVLTMGSIGLHWGWNTFAVEILSQQAMKFKHALALELILLATAGVLPVIWRLFTGRSR